MDGGGVLSLSVLGVGLAPWLSLSVRPVMIRLLFCVVDEVVLLDGVLSAIALKPTTEASAIP